MDLRFTPAEIAFRDEVRKFFREKIPAPIRERVSAGRHPTRDDIVTTQRILNARGWAVPNWPRQWGGQDWTPVQRYIFGEEMQAEAVPPPLPFNTGMVGPVIAAFGSEAQKQTFLPRAANLDDWWCQGFSEPGAGSDLASLKTARGARGRRLCGQRPKNLDHARAIRRLDFSAGPHRHGRQEAGGDQFSSCRHEDAGHHGAADRHDRRRAGSQRSLLRRRPRAGGEPRGPGEQGLGLREIPARQRAFGDRADRALEGAAAAHPAPRGARCRRAMACCGTISISASAWPRWRSSSRRWR